MKNKLLGSLALACVLTLSSGCATGPSRLSRTWDDWVNQQYGDNAWVTQILCTIIPVYPLVGFAMGVGDIIVVNPYHFWKDDAWDNKGTVFNHVNPTGAARTTEGYGL